eukprot:TRINITY_DN12493_c0_g1_i1.p1 TRINITY_DN12493_c0_g1~~TRINITY_DN12493_c0_g1_i1.p1  ORF type:complete len:106 (+),score=12.92 TRINITY_DN12493_c0_g1_i1:96-413(+)
MKKKVRFDCQSNDIFIYERELNPIVQCSNLKDKAEFINFIRVSIGRIENKMIGLKYNEKMKEIWKELDENFDREELVKLIKFQYQGSNESLTNESINELVEWEFQ